MKSRLLQWSLTAEVWGVYRRWSLHRAYEARREDYRLTAGREGLLYSEAATVRDVRERLKRRGYTPKPRRRGEIHTFALIPQLGWHSSLLPDLRLLGPVSECDYIAAGYHPREFLKMDGRARLRRREMNEMILPALRRAHALRPIDWIFCYITGLDVDVGVLKAAADALGVPMVNMCLDDKHMWDGPRFDGQRIGQADIAPAFDISWTSSRIACEWYMVEGARPLYMPEGFDAATFHPRQVAQDIPVSFVGAAYGSRPALVDYLRAGGVPVECRGAGWPGSGWVADAAEIFCRTRINLGTGGIGYSESLTSVKSRDFEIPGSGGGVYLTTFNPDLAQHFRVGEEILCYRTRSEMLELARYYLARPEEAAAIARNGHERALREHRWRHRYERLCRIFGILDEDLPKPG